MLKVILVACVVSLFIVGCWSGDTATAMEFRQERAKIFYVNPKYVTNVTVITRRVSRHEPYRTNLTGTSLVPFGNNVTLTYILQLKNGGDFRIQRKLCDCLKIKWMVKYMELYFSSQYTKCPFIPGTYYYRNMELPPKNMPIPVLSGDYMSILEFSVTATKEKILSAGTLLHFDNQAATKNSDTKNSDTKNPGTKNSDTKNPDTKNGNKNKKG